MKPERKSRLQNLGEAKQATEKRGRLFSLHLGVVGEKGVCAGGGRRQLSFSGRSKRVLYDQEFSQHRVPQARKVPRIYVDRERPGHGARDPREASDTNGLSSIAWPAREGHSTRPSCLDHHLSKRTLERIERFVQENRGSKLS